MNNTICIHPKDTTSDFLCPIHEVLSKKGIPLFYGDTNDQSFYDWKEKYCKNIDILIFLGHGASNSLYGSPKENSELPILFSIDDLQNLHCHTMYLLSCRSNELLEKNKIANKYMGFPIMHTSMQDLREEQENDYSFHMDLEESDINIFNDILVRSFCHALSSVSLNDTIAFYNEFILFLNRCNYKLLYKNKSYSNRWDIAELLYDLKDGICSK